MCDTSDLLWIPVNGWSSFPYSLRQLWFEYYSSHFTILGFRSWIAGWELSAGGVKTWIWKTECVHFLHSGNVDIWTDNVRGLGKVKPAFPMANTLTKQKFVLKKKVWKKNSSLWIYLLSIYIFLHVRTYIVWPLYVVEVKLVSVQIIWEVVHQSTLVPNLTQSGHLIMHWKPMTGSCSSLPSCLNSSRYTIHSPMHIKTLFWLGIHYILEVCLMRCFYFSIHPTF